MVKEEPHINFTGEEGLGRFLDLHELYLQYINSKFGKKVKKISWVRPVADSGRPESRQNMLPFTSSRVK
jgi:splicing factor 3A subunit 3